MQLVAGDLNLVNAVILSRMQSEIPLIPELAGHLIAGGGKRMRPMLTLASARLIGYTGTRHHRLAAAVEFIHTATLLHDDVVDGSDLRRGKRTANLIWGNPASILVGDFLFSRSFELMVEDGSLKVLKILSNASAVIAEGEVNQLTAARRIDEGQISRQAGGTCLARRIGEGAASLAALQHEASFGGSAREPVRRPAARPRRRRGKPHPQQRVLAPGWLNRIDHRAGPAKIAAPEARPRS